MLIYLSFSANIPRFVEEVTKEATRAKAYQLSEILVNNPGKPLNWNNINVKRIGLSDGNSNKTNFISYSKVSGLSTLCGNFKDVQDKLALNDSFTIFIFNITNNGNRVPLVDCHPLLFPKAVVNATVRRITAMNNSGKIELAEVIVQM